MILLDHQGHAERRHVGAGAIMGVLDWHRAHLGRMHALAAVRELLAREPHEPDDWDAALVDGRARLEGDTARGLRLVSL